MNLFIKVLSLSRFFLLHIKKLINIFTFKSSCFKAVNSVVSLALKQQRGCLCEENMEEAVIAVLHFSVSGGVGALVSGCSAIMYSQEIEHEELCEQTALKEKQTKRENYELQVRVQLHLKWMFLLIYGNVMDEERFPFTKDNCVNLKEPEEVLSLPPMFS